jgi:cytochrome bd-type quinol oxidase subunit 2
LVFGFTTIAMLFNNALQTLSQALLSTLVIGLAALIIRACSVLVIFYWRDDQLPRWLAWLFAICCFTIPLSFAAAGAYLLTGQLFWHSFTGWTLLVAAWLGLVSIGLLTMNPKRSSMWLPNELVFAGWMIVLGSVLPLAAKLGLAHIQKTPMLFISLLGIGGLTAALVSIKGSGFRLWRYAVAVGLIAPVLLALANRPYLVGGQIKLEQAFSAASYASAFLVGTAIILPLVLLGFYLFWRLLKSPEA